MNYQKNRVLAQMRKDFGVVSQKNGELVSENAVLRKENSNLKSAGSSDSSEILKKLTACEDACKASGTQVESLIDENKELREHIAKLQGVAKKKIDKGPKDGRRGKRGGPKL